MALSRILTIAILLTAPAPGHAQTTAKPAKAPAPRLKAEQTPGYQPMVIEGFTVLVSDEAMSHKDDPDYERKPLDVLQGELKTIVSLMPAKTVNVLRNVLIWVEWDDRIETSSGRPGNALATYYGGHQQGMLAKGMHPLQARNVTIHRLKSLTLEHQPKRDSGRCVILHEIAHAVHDQLLGTSNPAVKSAYKQAMERKLVEANTYASTNEMEFFAEMTCAYFDQLPYYPRTRADLKKHDPVTFKVMEGAWGKTKLVSKTVANLAPTAAPALRELDLGEPVLGPRISTETLEGRPSFVIYWNGINVSSQSCFTKVAAWDAELSDFGLVTAAVHLTGNKPFAVKSFAEGRGLTFAVTEGKWTQNSLIKDFKEFPLSLVYSHEGECLFRGSPFDAEAALRSAVGLALVGDLSADDAPKTLAPVTEALLNGKAPVTQFARLTSLTRSTDEAAAKAAKDLLAKMTERGRRRLEAAEPLVKDDPLEAFFALERLPGAFKDTPVAAKANELLAKLKQTKPVAVELKARAILAVVKKLEADLSSRPGSFDPTLPRFQSDNAAVLRQLDGAVQQMRRTWPSARATEQAVRIGERFGVGK